MRAERCTASACGGRERAPINCSESGRCARPSFRSVGIEEESASRGGGVRGAPGRDSCAPPGSPRSWRPCSRPDAARCRAPWCAGTLPAHTTLALALPTLTHDRLRSRVSDNLSEGRESSVLRDCLTTLIATLCARRLNSRNSRNTCSARTELSKLPVVPLSALDVLSHDDARATGRRLQRPGVQMADRAQESAAVTPFACRLPAQGDGRRR